MNTSDKKPAYAKPGLTKIGEFEEITRGGACGSILDADFPRGTPINQLTCS